VRSAPLALAAILGGCSLIPPYRAPTAPIPESFPFASPTSTAPTASQIAWRDFVGDPRLQALISAALANNRDLAVSVAQIDAARAQYRLQRAQQLPQGELSGSAVRLRQPAGGGDAASSVTFNSFDLALGVSAFELDFWGRARSLSEAARYSYFATVEARQAFRLSLIRDVAQTYLGLRETEERIVLAERTVSSRREGLEIARLRLDAGVTSTIDYDQSVALLTQADTQLADLRRTQAESANFLTVLVGGPVAEPLPAARPLVEQGLVDGLDPGLPSELLENRPDILRVEALLRAANANIGAARAAFFPRISLTGAAGLASSELEHLVGTDSVTWRFGGLVDLPIFDWGPRTARLRISQAQRDAVTASYQRTVQEAFREVADSLAGRRHLADQIAAQELAVAAQRRLAETARLRYDNGIAIYLEVLDAERNLFSAEQALVQLRGASLRNQVALYVALGGGKLE
jgi:multidrug efflux system outer membrane protein